MPEDLEGLEQKRASLYRELAETGDFRRGSIACNYRRCGKPNCCCARADHAGHGPQYLLMTKLGGKSQAKNLKPGAELAKIKEEVANHLRFREVVQKIVAISEQICEKRPLSKEAERPDLSPLKKTSRRSSRKKLRRR
jgi:hypothetical protein